jgi:transketolase
MAHRTCRARPRRTALRSALPKPPPRTALEAEWQTRFAKYREQHPALAAEFERRMSGMLPSTWGEHAAKAVHAIAAAGKTMATRKASQVALEAFAPALPELIGGSADLTGSNNTQHKHSKALTPKDASGNYIFYGVREFGMAAVMNGFAAHGGLIPYGGTFLVFSDYARNALRVASLVGLQSIFVLTHDSIGLGEDGPTHQPIEHLASLRVMPGMELWRPCDTVETAVAWRAAIERRTGPTCLVLTRQDLPHVPRLPEQVAAIARGGYIVSSSAEAPAITLIATGSEVQLAVGSRSPVSRCESCRCRARRCSIVSRPTIAIMCCRRKACASPSRPVPPKGGGGTSPGAGT